MVHLTICSDAVVRTVSSIVEKIPGLERVLVYVQEKVTLFVMALIAPFVQPVIKAVSASLKLGNNTIVDSSTKTQFEVWTDPQSSDPTHSMLSKDHFSNILNEPAGLVAAQVVEYVAPRMFYAWQHPDVPVDQIMLDVCHVFHHPALRDHNLEIHRKMYSAVEQWVQKRGGSNLDNLLSSESVKAGNNHIVNEGKPLIDTAKISSDIKTSIHSHIKAHTPSMPGIPGFGSLSNLTNSPLALFNRKRELGFEDERPDIPAGSFEAMSSVVGNSPQQGHQPQHGAQPTYGRPSPQPAQYSYPFGGGPQPGYGGGYQQGPYGQQPPGQYPSQQPPAQYPGQQPPGQYPDHQKPYGPY
jgi:Heterokaryon incompatibility protein Het-C